MGQSFLRKRIFAPFVTPRSPRGPAGVLAPLWASRSLVCRRGHRGPHGQAQADPPCLGVLNPNVTFI